MKALLFITILFSSLFAQDIDIKGLKIGMSFEDASKLFKLSKSGNISFATNKDGTKPTFASKKIDFLGLKFENNKIREIALKIQSDHYDTIIAPLKDKYKMVCESSIIQNRMGAKFNQEECVFISNDVQMNVTKYSQNINESFILVSKPLTNEELNKSNEKIKSDI